jgi:hypothetical protein
LASLPRRSLRLPFMPVRARLPRQRRGPAFLDGSEVASACPGGEAARACTGGGEAARSRTYPGRNRAPAARIGHGIELKSKERKKNFFPVLLTFGP